MANDATTQIPQDTHGADMADAHDGGYAAVQVAEATATTATAPDPSTPADGKVVHVEIPQGGTVVRVPVQAGETVILPAPFDAHHDLAAKEGNGNLAIKVGDVTVILQGYIEASNDPAHPVTIDGSDGQPVDIATVLASTDPNLDIQTAAGPAAGAQGADNTGAILAALAGGPGLGGLNAVGVLDATELQYKLIDNSIRQEQETLLNGPAGPLTLTITKPNHDLFQAFLHDPIVTHDMLAGHLDIDSFLNGVPGTQYAGFTNEQADFNGTQSAVGLENEHATSTVIVDPSNNTTVQVTLTTDALKAEGLTSNGVPLTYEVSQDGSTIFGFRGDGTGGTDGALVLVVHVGNEHPGAGTEHVFDVDYYLVNRLDDTKGDGTQLDLNIGITATTGDDRSISGTATEIVHDDAPTADKTDYSNEENGKTVDSTVIGKVDEDWLSKGNHDKNSDGTGNAGQHGDDIGSAHVAGQLMINYGADGPAGFVMANSSSAPASTFSALQLENPTTDTAYAVGDTISGVTSHGNELHVLSIVTGVDGVETMTVGYGTTSVFTIALHTDPNDAQLGHFDFNLLTGVDNSIGKDTEGNATVSLGAVGTDDDGDPVHTTINIQINDDIPGIPDQHNNPDTPTTGTGYAIVDEDQLAGGAHDDNVKVHGTTVAHGQVNVDFGGDGAGSFGFTGITEGAPVTLVGGGTLKTDDGTAVVFHIENKGGHEIITGMAGNVEVFKLDLNTDLTPNNADLGKWTFTLEQPVSHPIAGSEDDLLASFGIQVTDGDGSQATGSIKIDINDDSPVARNDTDTVDNATDTATGNVITGKDTTSGAAGADTSGADAPVHVIAVNGAAAGAGGGFTAVGQFGTLVMDDQGQYTYTRKDGSPDNSSESFTYTIVDKDGDTSTATLTVGVDDHVPTVKVPTDAGSTTVDEKGLGVHGNNWVGSGEIADGNPNNNSDKSEIVNGKIAYTEGDAPAAITIDGKTVAAGLDIVHADGTLHINSIGNGTIDYTYTLTTNTSGDTTHDDFAVKVVDKDGDTANGTLVINIIDDTPKALNDTDTVDNKTGTATGNVVTGADTTSGDAGKDVGGADGFKGVTDLTGFAGSATPADHDATNGLSVTGQWGTLTLDPATGQYTYTRNAGSPDTYTENFTYTIVDGDGDKSTATLTVSVNDKIPTVHVPTDAGSTTVDEKGLGFHGAGNALVGSGEIADGNGNNNSDKSEIVSGKITYTEGDAPATITIDGKTVVAGMDIVHADGTLHIDSIGNGTIDYTYTLTTNTNGDTTHDDFAVKVVDQDGDAANGTLVINIKDDVPTAHDDTVNIGNSSSYVSGLNVESNDVFGADGKTAGGGVVGVAAGLTGADASTGTNSDIHGKYGTLHLNADGTFTYTRDNNDPTNGQLTDQFTYTIKDGDGDTSHAVLNVVIKDDGCHITNLTPELNGGDTLVNEDHLLASRGAGESAGTDPTGATTGTGDFTITAPDGVGNLTVGGKDVIVDGKFTATSFTTPLGNTLSLDSYDANTGKIGYHYTLLDNETHAPGQGANSLFENFAVQLTDKDGDKANDILSVNIVDDVPTTTGGSKDVSTAGQYNLMLTIDLSNSMNDSSGVNKADGTGTYTKLELEKAAIADLLATYQAQGDVAVHIVWFNDPGSGGPNSAGDPSNPGVGSNDGGWMTVSQAIAYVNGLVAQGNTNYDIAIDKAEQSFNDKTGYIAGGTNVSYFFSDGMPNEHSGPNNDGKDGIGGAQQTAWETFLDNNNVNSFAIGVGGQAVGSALTPIAYNGASTPASDPAGNTQIVTDLNQLSTVVSQTAAAGAHGNLFGDLNAVYGADGPGHVNMFTLNGVEHDYDSAHPIVKVDLAQGSFTMDMNTGDYTYSPNSGAAQSSIQVKFNVVDADGDLSNTSTLTLTTLNHAPVISSNGLADSASIQVIEGATNVTTVHAVDVDGPSITYSISGGADAGKFVIDANTGVLTFITGHTKANPQDVGGNNVYDVVVTATDDHGAKDSQALAVTVEAAAVAVADHIYTNSTDNVTVLDQFLLNNDTDKDTSHALLSVADVIPTSGQATYFDKDHLPTHGPDTHGSGWTTFNLDTTNDGGGDGYLKSGDKTGFDYTATDGAGEGASAHVTITYNTGSTIDASSDNSGAILIGTTGNETMKGGSGADVFITNGGSDTINGGAGFDQVALSGNAAWSKNFTNVEMANIHDGEIGKLSINAADVFQQSAGTVGGKDVDLFVTGDHQGTAQDTVNLTGFAAASVGSGTFTDAGTNNAHTYDLYQGTGANAGVIVAIEHGVTVNVN